MTQSRLRDEDICTGEDSCSICLEPCEKRKTSKNVGCKNQHFVHFDCFVRMACACRNQTEGGLRLICPLCRARFECENCGAALHRFVCINCIVMKTFRYPTLNISYDLGALLVDYPYEDNQPRPAPRRIQWRREELIVSQHIVWSLFSVLALSWISTIWPLATSKGGCLWREIGTSNTIVNWLIASDRIVSEILGKFSDRNDYFINIIAGTFKCVHWSVRMLWFAVLLMTPFS